MSNPTTETETVTTNHEDFLNDLVNRAVESTVYESTDRGFIGPTGTTPFVYFYKIELGGYGYLDASFEIARPCSSSTGLYMDNSVSSLSHSEYNSRAEKEIADSLSTIDGTIHALQNYRRDLLEAIEKYKVLRSAKIVVEEKAGV